MRARPVVAETPGWRRANALQIALLDVLRAPYVGGSAPAIARTSACALLGHPPKYATDPAEKTESERGCICGMRDWV